MDSYTTYLNTNHDARQGGHSEHLKHLAFVTGRDMTLDPIAAARQAVNCAVPHWATPATLKV